MFAVFFSILLLAVLAVIAYDFLPDALNWFWRIKIGRFYDYEEWIDSVKDVNLKWLLKGAPRVPKNENQRLKLIDEIKNRKSVSSICCWQDAALLKAATEKCGSGTRESVNALVDRYIDSVSGEWKVKPERIDSAILAYEMLSNEFIDNGRIEPAVKTVAQMLKQMYKEFGYVPYNINSSGICFVDTIGMICPFMIKYAAVYNEPVFIDMAIKQIGLYYKFGFDEKTGLPFHCYDAEKRTRLGICGWGRGCGWWVSGITDSLKELLKSEGFEKEKVLLLKLSTAFLDDFAKYINDDGSISRMVLTTSLNDSSASAMIAYCYAYMFKIVNKKAYRDNAEKIISYLRSATRRNGVIDYSQGDTMGIGYYSSKLSVVPAAQGFAIAAADIIYR